MKFQYYRRWRPLQAGCAHAMKNCNADIAVTTYVHGTPGSKSGASGIRRMCQTLAGKLYVHADLATSQFLEWPCSLRARALSTLGETDFLRTTTHAVIQHRQTPRPASAWVHAQIHLRSVSPASIKQHIVSCEQLPVV